MADTVETLAIIECFNRLGSPATPHKGVVLAASICGDANARIGGDPDLLVFKQQLKGTSELLLDRGYDRDTQVHTALSAVAPECFEYLLLHPRNGMVVELRTWLERFGVGADRAVRMDWDRPDRQSGSLAGSAVLDFNPETMLLVLVLMFMMHGSKHSWSRLRWIVDVAKLLAVRPNLDWRAIEPEARPIGLWLTLVLGVLFADRVADTPIPQQALCCFEAVRAVRQCAQYIDANPLDPIVRRPPAWMPDGIGLLGTPGRLSLSFRSITSSLLRGTARSRNFPTCAAHFTIWSARCACCSTAQRDKQISPGFNAHPAAEPHVSAAS